MALSQDQLDQYGRIRQNLLDEIEEVSSQGAAVNYQIDGQEVNWTDYLRHLWKMTKELDDKLSREDDLYEELTQVY